MENKHKAKPNLIVMLTYNDRTIKNAFEIFQECQELPVDYWGIKEEGIPLCEMKALFSYMKQLGKTTVLEVVAYSEDKCISGVKTAIECNCDILMGTVYYDSVNHLCRENGIKYMPFAGNVSQRPSVLTGDVSLIISNASETIEKGIFGFDLLSYRHNKSPHTLTKEFLSKVNAPVCIAGSVDSFEKIDEIIDNGAWGFTIGSAFIDNVFGETVPRQIKLVYDYVQERSANV